MLENKSIPCLIPFIRKARECQMKNLRNSESRMNRQ